VGDCVVEDILRKRVLRLVFSTLGRLLVLSAALAYGQEPTPADGVSQAGPEGSA